MPSSRRRSGVALTRRLRNGGAVSKNEERACRRNAIQQDQDKVLSRLGESNSGPTHYELHAHRTRASPGCVAQVSALAASTCDRVNPCSSASLATCLLTGDVA
jgi:hypothetical protein